MFAARKTQRSARPTDALDFYVAPIEVCSSPCRLERLTVEFASKNAIDHRMGFKCRIKHRQLAEDLALAERA
jgi:hypothetical protein